MTYKLQLTSSKDEFERITNTCNTIIFFEANTRAAACFKSYLLASKHKANIASLDSDEVKRGIHVKDNVRKEMEKGAIVKRYEC